MSLNNLNNKRTRDDKTILITLAKTANGYCYFNDTLHERSKIKIPLDELTSRENPVSQCSESSDIKKDKLTGDKPITMNGTSHAYHPAFGEGESKQMANDSSIANIQKDQEEIPLLAKMAERNFKTPLIVPSCSQWFKLDEIHELEMKALPEFFCNRYPSKTPEVYKEYRNYIINLYRENTTTYLTATSKFNFLI
jgi:SWI/SNF complex subunit SWI3